MKTVLREKIIQWLKSNGIEASESGDQVTVNRDAICNSPFAKSGCPEETTYSNVLARIEDQFFHPLGYLWTGKSDEDLFLDTLGGGHF